MKNLRDGLKRAIEVSLWGVGGDFGEDCEDVNVTKVAEEILKEPHLIETIRSWALECVGEFKDADITKYGGDSRFADGDQCRWCGARPAEYHRAGCKGYAQLQEDTGYNQAKQEIRKKIEEATK